MTDEVLTESTLKALRLTYVPRWAIVPMLRQQSVAEHSFRVAFIARHLTIAHGLPNFGPLIVQALAHDLDEALTGDIPASEKKPIRAPEPSLLKLADLIEAYTWLRKWGLPNYRQEKIVVSLNNQIEALADEIGGTMPQAVDDLIIEIGKGE